jgi:hypothetical protein
MNGIPWLRGLLFRNNVFPNSCCRLTNFITFPQLVGIYPAAHHNRPEFASAFSLHRNTIKCVHVFLSWQSIIEPFVSRSRLSECFATSQNCRPYVHNVSPASISLNLSCPNTGLFFDSYIGANRCSFSSQLCFDQRKVC